METKQSDIQRWQTSPEGQFFERKSARDRRKGRVKPRKVKEIAWDVAETLSAMANADAGELIVGIENDGTLSGVPLPDKKIQLLLGVPRDRNYVNPPLPCSAREVVAPDGARSAPFRCRLEP